MDENLSVYCRWSDFFNEPIESFELFILMTPSINNIYYRLPKVIPFKKLNWAEFKIMSFLDSLCYQEYILKNVYYDEDENAIIYETVAERFLQDKRVFKIYPIKNIY